MTRKNERSRSLAQGFCSFQNDKPRLRPYHAAIYEPGVKHRYVGKGATFEEGRALARAYLQVREQYPDAAPRALRETARRRVDDQATGQRELPFDEPGEAKRRLKGKR